MIWSWGYYSAVVLYTASRMSPGYGGVENSKLRSSIMLICVVLCFSPLRYTDRDPAVTSFVVVNCVFEPLHKLEKSSIWMFCPVTAPISLYLCRLHHCTRLPLAYKNPSIDMSKRPRPRQLCQCWSLHVNIAPYLECLAKLYQDDTKQILLCWLLVQIVYLILFRSLQIHHLANHGKAMQIFLLRLICW